MQMTNSLLKRAECSVNSESDVMYRAKRDAGLITLPVAGRSLTNWS